MHVPRHHIDFMYMRAGGILSQNITRHQEFRDYVRVKLGRSKGTSRLVTAGASNSADSHRIELPKKDRKTNRPTGGLYGLELDTRTRFHEIRPHYVVDDEERRSDLRERELRDFVVFYARGLLDSDHCKRFDRVR